MKNQSIAIRKYDSIVQKYTPAVLEGDTYNLLLDDCNRSFGLSIQKCYGDFVVIGRPIITRAETILLVSLYKSKIPNHYHTMYSMLGYKKRKK